MQNNKNILLILFSMQAGGAAIATINLAISFRKIGHNVTILSLTDSAGGNQLKQLDIAGIEYEKFSYKKFKPIYYPRIFLSLLKLFNRSNYNIVNIASAYPAILALLAIKISGIKTKTIVNFHTTLSEYLAKEPFYKKLFVKICAPILRSADKLVNVSNAAAKDAEKTLGAEKVYSIYNPACTEDDLSYVPQRAPHKWLSDKSMIKFVSCGRLCEGKNFTLMISAFAKIYESTPSARLILLGDGELRPQLEQISKTLLLDSVVSFEGFVDNPKDYFYFADFFWLTSNYEGFSMVLAEALAAGTACISTDCPYGPREVLGNGKYGILLPMNQSADEMAQLILSSLDSLKKDKKFYKEGAKRFVDTKVAKEYIAL